MSTLYHVFGSGDPIRLGRKSYLQQIADAISKETPDNLMAVGPKLIGKTTILQDIPRSIDLGEAGYVAHVYWNLGHGTPADDEEFLNQFRSEVRSPLLKARPDLSDWFSDDQKPYDSLDGALEELWDGGKRLLVVMDSFDYVLKRAELKRNLWDNLADLLRKPGLTLITGSRLPLRELCGDEETMTSELWELFESEPMRIGPFEREELAQITDPMREQGYLFDADVENAVLAETGGVPILVCAILHRFLEKGDKAITSKMVQEEADRILESEPTYLGELWSHCDTEEQSALAAIASGPLKASSLPFDRKKSLLQRGYVMENRRGVYCSSEIMRKYSDRYGSSVEDLNRIFSNPEDYCRRVKEVLELRLSQLEGADSVLLNFVKRTLRDLDSEPEIPVYDMRGIAERAISLVVDAEFPDGNINPDWVRVWQHGGATHPREALQGRVPDENGRKADLFLLMTGDKKARVMRRVSNHISKGTALLISHLWTIGRAGVHRDEGHEYGPLFAGSVCFAAVELCEHLARELPRG
jgi:hypothetical protein